MSLYQQHADSVYNQLIELEANAEPEQLFLCSYLLGHISLVSAEQGSSKAEFENNVEQSLNNAFETDKLSTQDIADIRKLWQQLSG